MKSVPVIFHTLISRLLLLIVMLVYTIPFIIMLCIPRRWLYQSSLFYWFVYSFYWIVLKCSFLKITYTGMENLPDKPSIMVANHQSSLDIPVVGALLNAHPQIWLATTHLKKFFLYRIGLPKFVVWVDMRTPQKGMRSLVQVIKCINKTKQHIIIFPEGARFTDGSIHNFFAGFAILARKTGRAVIPVKIEGLNKVYPPDTFWIYRHPVHVTIGKPLYIQKDESEQEFRTRVRTWFVA